MEVILFYGVPIVLAFVFRWLRTISKNSQIQVEQTKKLLIQLQELNRHYREQEKQKDLR